LDDKQFNRISFKDFKQPMATGMLTSYMWAVVFEGLKVQGFHPNIKIDVKLFINAYSLSPWIKLIFLFKL